MGRTARQCMLPFQITWTGTRCAHLPETPINFILVCLPGLNTEASGASSDAS